MSRSRKMGRRTNHPPDGAAWIWHTVELLASPAWCTQSINCRRLMNFLEVEHLRHAGNENGSLGGVVGEAITRLQVKSRELAKAENLESRSRNLDAVLNPLETLKSVALELTGRNNKHSEFFTDLACAILFHCQSKALVCHCRYWRTDSRALMTSALQQANCPAGRLGQAVPASLS